MLDLTKVGFYFGFEVAVERFMEVAEVGEVVEGVYEFEVDSFKRAIDAGAGSE